MEGQDRQARPGTRSQRLDPVAAPGR